MRWVGIDEAGYGPNLGPMVMTAVVAEGRDDREPDVWGDLTDTVARAGDPSDRLWVDDSKAILRAPSGRTRLEATCRAVLAATRGAAPGSLADLLASVGAGTLDDVELTPWLDAPESDTGQGRSIVRGEREGSVGATGSSANPCAAASDRAHGFADEPVAPVGGIGAFEAAPWRIVGVHSIVVCPSRFNAELGASGSKAKVHFAAFARLLGMLWDRAGDGVVTHVRGDKHGGRHFYHDPLLEVFPDVSIDRGCEGPHLSQYALRASGRRLALSLMPRADASDGLVAMASIVSKSIRERWMDCFNAHWTARIPGLRPTAGYPLDARRFRQSIEPSCQARGLDPSQWWRIR